jgi:hypothetical protein
MSEIAGRTRRAADRLTVRCPAYIRQVFAVDRPVMLINLSATGFRCSCFYQLDPAVEATLIIFGAGIFPATIRWKGGIMMGASFHEELGWRRLNEIRSFSSRQASR